MKIMKFFVPATVEERALDSQLERFGIKTENIDVTKDEEKAKKYKVNLTPTLIFADDKDKEVDRIEGVVRTSILIGKLKEHKIKIERKEEQI